MLITVVEIWLHTHHLRGVVGSLDDAVFDNFKDVELGKKVVGSSRIIKIVRTVDRLEVGNKHSASEVSSVLVESEESDSQEVQSKDAQCYISN